MKSDFSLERLETLLKFQNVFWRHDIDFSLDAALKMGEFEAERGVCGTFFLFFEENWPFYSMENALSAAYDLRKLGHFIARHVDERIHSLEELPHSFISFHCPTEAVLWRKFPNFTNAYAPVWQDRYISDSGGRFRGDEPEKLLDSSFHWQVNLHPEWWFTPNWLDEVTDEQHLEFFYCEKPKVGA